MLRSPRHAGRLSIFPIALCALSLSGTGRKLETAVAPQNPTRYVTAIPTPAGCKRVPLPDGSFGAWLRQRPLKPAGTPVKLYNGNLRANQQLHVAVLDIPIGTANLMQCADAIMYLRARFLFESNIPRPICFTDNTGRSHCIPPGASERLFQQTMQQVYAYCNTASLSCQLKTISYGKLEAGDVMLRGGFPGHGMMVIDVCANQQGEKFFLLAQGFMPAMDFHIVINPYQPQLSPWYKLDTNAKGIYTPNYHFSTKETMRFP